VERVWGMWKVFLGEDLYFSKNGSFSTIIMLESVLSYSSFYSSENALIHSSKFLGSYFS